MPPKKKQMDFLSRAKTAARTVKIAVPGMEGDDVFVRTLSAAKVDAITNECRLPGAKAEDPAGYDDNKLILMIVAASVVDGRGESLIPLDRWEEIKELPNAIKIKLQSEALAVNGMGGVSVEGND
jgi:hypothetical protein